MHVRLLLGLAAAAVAGAWAQPAAAQTGTLSILQGTFRRDQPFRPETQGPNWISRADCLADDNIYLTVNFSRPTTGGMILEAWAGISADCTLYEERQGSTAGCWLLFQGPPTSTSMQIVMRTQDIVARNVDNDPQNGPNSGTAADCDEAAWPPDGADIKVHFMLVGADGRILPDWTPTSWQDTRVDVHGPLPPTGLTAGVGENRVILEWDVGAIATDVAGYNFYCASVGSTSTASITPQGVGILDGGVLIDAGLGGADGSAGSGGTGGFAGDAAASGGSDAGPTLNPACPTAALVPGEVPADNTLRCGSVRGQFVAGGEATGLDNFTRYAVAVAGVDTVQNVGPLSEVVCGQPQLVDDFFERYRAAGGEGGGGFCSVGARPARGALLLVLGAGLAFAVRRRRWLGGR